MKTIGLIGGMSWESTSLYYTLINEAVKRELGGLHSAKILLYSVDFAQIEKLQACGDWQGCNEILTDIALRLQGAGAEALAICTNTMHKVVPHMQTQVRVPILHIADMTGQHIKKQGLSKIALLGTKYTMEQDFYKQRLVDMGIEVLIPDAHGVQMINDVIYQELCLGQVHESSKQAYVDIIHSLQQRGAEGVILGCTEICMLVNQKDVNIPVFDTTCLHAEGIARHILTDC